MIKVEESKEKFCDEEGKETIPVWVRFLIHSRDRLEHSQAFAGEEREVIASCKHTGCIDFQYVNGKDVEEYFHICDLDEYIERLQKLREGMKALWK